jgi:hypothetical protein
LYPSANTNQEHLANGTRTTRKFHPDAPLIKANKLTEENLAKQNFDLETPGRLDRPLQAVRPPLPENSPWVKP